MHPKCIGFHDVSKFNLRNIKKIVTMRWREMKLKNKIKIKIKTSSYRSWSWLQIALFSILLSLYRSSMWIVISKKHISVSLISTQNYKGWGGETLGPRGSLVCTEPPSCSIQTLQREDANKCYIHSLLLLRGLLIMQNSQASLHCYDGNGVFGNGVYSLGNTVGYLCWYSAEPWFSFHLLGSHS